MKTVISSQALGISIRCCRLMEQWNVIRVFYLPTDAQEKCFKKNIKIYIKTAPTCFSLITVIREHIIRVC